MSRKSPRAAARGLACLSILTANRRLQRLGRVNRLVDGFAAAKAEAPIETNGPVVLRRDFEISAAQARTLEAVQRLQQQGAAQTAAAMQGGDPQVLNRPQAAAIAHPLHRAAVAVGRTDQPGRLGAKTGFAADLPLPVEATAEGAQAGEDDGVDLR